GIAKVRVEPLFERRSEEIARERGRFGESMPNLNAWKRMRVRAPSRAFAESIAARLLADSRIVSAFVEPEAVPASFELGVAEQACPVKTPLYQPLQGYLAEAPHGINAPIAWARDGGRGEGIWFADIEGGWNMRHEDIPGERMELVSGTPFEDRG